MSEVKEGFLCPICMADLGDVIQLQVHFEEKHSKEDPVFLQNIKDLFGKAKKILNKDEEFGNNGSFSENLADLGGRLSFGVSSGTKIDHDPVSGVHLELLDELPEQFIPKVISHTEYFKMERKKKLDRNMATNQVLMRLEKLMKNLPSDPVKRRAHEQSVVPWISKYHI